MNGYSTTYEIKYHLKEILSLQVVKKTKKKKEERQRAIVLTGQARNWLHSTESTHLVKGSHIYKKGTWLFGANEQKPFVFSSIDVATLHYLQ